MMLSTLSFGALNAKAAEPGSWQPIDTEPMIAAGSALDLSGLNDAPAGKYGFIQIDANGDYRFENAPQSKVKLYGANVTWNMMYGTPEDAELTATRLARLGYNVVRLHNIDSMADWAPGIFLQNNSASPQFNTDRLDRLEYFISRLKAKGIYVAIDVFQLYDFKNIPGLGEYAESYNSPYLLPFLTQAMDMWKSIANLWLSHVNPYTGLALKDDPVLVGVSPWNESLVQNMRLTSMKAPFRDFLLPDFNQYLAGIGQSPVSQVPNNYWDTSGTMRAWLTSYYSGKTITAANTMRSYLKQELGVKAPIGGLNHMISPNVDYWRDQASDVYENHLYYQFVNDRVTENGKAGYQYRPLKFPRLSMAFDPATIASYPKDWASDRFYNSYYPQLSLRQPYAKPFILTEFQDTFPVKGREETGIFVGAAGAYQGWDMMNRYSFGRDAADAYTSKRLGVPEQFSIVNDPLAVASETEAALLYRTGAVQAGKPQFAIVRDRTWALTSGAASENEPDIANMMFIPHLFNTVTVYVDNPSLRFGVYRITPELTPQQIQAGQFPAANKLALSGSMTDRQVAEVFIQSMDPSATKTAMLAALNGNKLLSDTGQLLFDLNLNTYMVQTSNAIAAAGTMNNHTFTLGTATVTGDVYKGTFFASSLDNQKLEDSGRLLLVYKTDVAGTGEQWVTLPTGELKYITGTLPTLAKVQTAQFTLAANRPATGYKAYKLALNGVRLQEIPVAVSGNTISVQLETDKGFAFELVYVGNNHIDTTAPTAPANLTATAGSSSQIMLHWQASSDESGVAGYRIYRDGQQIATVNGAVNSYKDTGLTIAATYRYTVRAFDPGDRLSDASNEAVTTTTNTLFEDNFEDGNANDWTVIWGTFSVVTDGSTKAYLSDNRNNGGTKSVTGETTWTNYSTEAKGKVDTWNSRTGLVARYVDSNNYYCFAFDYYYKRAFITKVQNGAETTLASVPVSNVPSTGIYHTYRFEVNGNALKGFMDGQQVIAITDSTFTAGKTGVFSHLQKVFFDDVAVRVIPQP